MSLASQGALEVERYIGSCLISSNIRQGVHKSSITGGKKIESVRGKARNCYPSQSINYTSCAGNVDQCQVQYGPGSWAGTPLISMTSSPRKCNHQSSPSLGQQQQQQTQQANSCEQSTQHQQQQQQQQQTGNHPQRSSPLSRLAVHTQGAPLILAGRFHNRGKAHNNSYGNVNSSCSSSNSNHLASINNTNYSQNNGNTISSNTTTVAQRCPSPRSQRSTELAKKVATNCNGKDGNNAGTNIANIDSLSIASDESSNNSENSLPRIIKPRKRRKRDRKPTNNVVVAVDGAKQDDQQPQPQQQQQHQQQQQQQQQQMNVSSVEQSNAVPLKNYVLSSGYEARYEPHMRNHRRPPIAVGRESVYGCMPHSSSSSLSSSSSSSSSMQEIVDVRSQRFGHRHTAVKVLGDNRNVIVPVSRVLQQPKSYRATMHHQNRGHNGNINNNNNNNNNNNTVRYLNEYNNSIRCEDSGRDGFGSCQSRYCDPSGQLWDVDPSSYSPFLCRPCPASAANVFCDPRFPQLPIFLSRPNLGCQEHFVNGLFEQMEEQHRETSNGGTILRRSWSDPTSYFTEEISAPSKDVGVIGDRGQSDTSKRRTLWRGDTLDVSSSTVNGSQISQSGSNAPSPQGLEVSTEIVTSPNGHRDLEIKFYSPSPNAPNLEEDKSLLFEDDDSAEKEDDSADIWSYHESKLQQDFRTLLQAEE